MPQISESPFDLIGSRGYPPHPLPFSQRPPGFDRGGLLCYGDNDSVTSTDTSTMNNPPRFLRLPEVTHVTGLSKATIYRQAKSGEFPSPRKIGARASAWLSNEVEAWMTARLAT